jgi:hypothetical protein
VRESKRWKRRRWQRGEYHVALNGGTQTYTRVMNKLERSKREIGSSTWFYDYGSKRSHTF